MRALFILVAVAFAHDQPLDTVHTVDTVDTGVLRFLIKGPCSPQILEEFNDLAVIANRYSRHPAIGMRWNTNKWDNQMGVHAVKYTRPTDVAAVLGGDDGTVPATGYANYYADAEEKRIRLNHVTVAVECCDAFLGQAGSGDPASSTGGNTEAQLSAPDIDDTIAGYGWYPCHDLMQSLYAQNMLPNSIELYSGGWLAAADTDTIDQQTSNPDPSINSATAGGMNWST